jgi:glycosyltransferase involved in cell wall biosynthesis
MPAATGWLVPPDDSAELARAIDLAFSLGDEVRERLAARARAFVVDQFGMDAMCARTVEVYRELLRPAEKAQVAMGATVARASGCGRTQA